MSQYEYTNYIIIDLKDVQFYLLPYTVVYNFNYCGKSFKNMHACIVQNIVVYNAVKQVYNSRIYTHVIHGWPPGIYTIVYPVYWNSILTLLY